MKHHCRISLVLMSLFWLMATSVSAQSYEFNDHWATKAECEAANGAASYYPTIKHAQALGKDEEVVGLPQDACIKMDVPDRKGKVAYVRIMKDRRVVMNTKTGKIVRLEECNNPIHEVFYLPSPIPANGLQGERGPQGLQGPQGERGPAGPAGNDGADAKQDQHKSFLSKIWKPVAGAVLVGGVVYGLSELFGDHQGAPKADAESKVNIHIGFDRVGVSIPIGAGGSH